VRGLLVQLRRDAGLNQTALAARLRITQSQVSKYERGERALADARLRAWLAALGTSLEAFDAALLARQVDPPRSEAPTLRG
jgi:transcriptional regulator with XRE-family HTH domain